MFCFNKVQKLYIYKTRIFFFFLSTETVLGLASSFQITIWKHFYKSQLSKMDKCFNNLYPVLLDISCLPFEFGSSPCSLPLSRDDWFIVSVGLAMWYNIFLPLHDQKTTGLFFAEYFGLILLTVPSFLLIWHLREENNYHINRDSFCFQVNCQ